jgi:hypothetical protein
VSGKGLLVALMEPELGMQDEFDDWYDLEHIPHMRSVEGLVSAERFVVVDGWPRYAALYDLEDISVLTSDSYRAVTGGRFSPWSRRILQRVHGWRRLTFEQREPGGATLLAGTGALALVLAGSSGAAAELAAEARADSRTLQVRAYAPAAASGPHAVLWEAGSLEALLRLSAPALRESSWSARMVRYSRRDPASAFARLEAEASP